MSGNRFFKKKLYRLVTALSRRTSFPMLVMDWKRLKSPSVINQVMSSGYFRQAIKPVEPELNKYKNVLVIAPHQDDEAIGCGGLLIRMKNAWKSTVLFVTDGFQSKLEEAYKGIVDKRNKEAIAALKFSNSGSIFLSLPNENLLIDKDSADKLREAIEIVNPDLILAPWMFDRPEKHRICDILLFHALKDSKIHKEVPIWSYQVHNVLFPNTVVDISDVIEEKKKMIAAYESQISDVAAYDSHIIGLNQWNAQYHPQRKRGYSETYFAIPNGDWQKLFEEIIIPNQDDYIKFV